MHFLSKCKDQQLSLSIIKLSPVVQIVIYSADV